MDSDDTIHRIAGRLGLKEGAIPPWWLLDPLGSGIIGGAD
jgi:hypothetical protein